MEDWQDKTKQSVPIVAAPLTAPVKVAVSAGSPG
jgi:hypothetical protein